MSENRVDITTDRLHIRYYQQADLESHYQLLTQAFGSNTTYKEVQTWLTWTVDNYRELANLYQPPYGDYAITLKATGVMIGSVGIVQTVVPWGVLHGQSPDQHHYLNSPEFGLFWGILPDYQQQGYATEAGQAMMNYLFHTVQTRQVVATTDHDNLASQKTMEKIGMTLYRNPTETPHWCQVVGLCLHPALR